MPLQNYFQTPVVVNVANCECKPKKGRESIFYNQGEFVMESTQNQEDLAGTADQWFHGKICDKDPFLHRKCNWE